MNVSKGKILAIDDSQLNIMALQKILSEDYDVQCENDPVEGLAAVKSFRPDLVLLDVVMPRMSGFEVIRAMKQDPETADIPVVFLTGLSDSKNERTGLELGAADYIYKPFDVYAVLLRVKTQFKIINLLRELFKLSMIDQLTGLGNRRHFDIIMRNEWLRSKRTKAPLSVVLADIDYFKHFNDTYGHLAGDAVLQGVACTIKEYAKRATDHVVRWGGEEFAIIMPDTSAAGAVLVAEKIRREVERTPYRLSEKEEVKVTISLGANTRVACDSCQMEGFVDDADAALYMAKEGGRNKVVAAAAAGC